MQVLPEPERPIDLFKAIFEADDDDDDDDEEADDKPAEHNPRPDLDPASALVKAEPDSGAQEPALPVLEKQLLVSH